MYKIQLFDLNLYPSFVSGVIEVYTDDIDEFQHFYLKQSRATVEQKERFFQRALDRAGRSAVSGRMF